MRDVFNTKKTPLKTMEELRMKFPRFYDELTDKFPGLELDPRKRNFKFDQFDFDEAYDMGQGQAALLWGRYNKTTDGDLPPEEQTPGLAVIWLDDKMIDLHDFLDSNYEPGEEGLEACSLAQEAFGDGEWTEMMEQGWGKKTKARLDKMDARLAGLPPIGGMSWEDILGPEEEEPIQAPLNPKKSFRN